MKSTPKKKVVVLGSGFAALSFLKNIDLDLLNVTVVSPRNHFIFTPLLPSTTVGTIEFRSIIEPIRSVRSNVEYFQAECTAIDVKKRVIRCEGQFDRKEFKLNYDILVMAVGASVNTYGVPGVKEHALFLKELSDARAIRQRIVECFEQAAQPMVSSEEQDRLLHFVVVGGGPTGVEFAAEVHDFLEEDIRRIYRELSAKVSILLLEATEHILSTFDAALSDYTARLFKRQNIQLRTGSLVTKIDAKNIYLKDKTRIPYGLVVWTAGVGPQPLVKTLTLEKDSFSRLQTDGFFQVSGAQGLYALGDCATPRGQNFPATAQVAQQEGKYLAQMLSKRERGLPVKPFQYRHYGMLAYVGSNRALADLAAVKGKGFSTWLFWRSAYLTRLVSFKNKVLVVFDWFKTLVFGRDISRF
ncbi:MAG: FAD-dependent oxidoreductase [Ignavibacteriales bacterium]|nr:FAD-dependent oxidoreductase [Ignavibacteriales bacterium]